MGKKVKWPYLNLEEYYVQNFDYFEMDFHNHLRLEIMLVITGNCCVSVKNQLKERQDFNLKGGDYVVIYPEVLHQLEVQKGRGCRMICVEFGRNPSGVVASEEEGSLLSDFSLGFKKYLEVSPPIILLKDQGVLCHTLLQLIQEKGQSRLDEDSNLLVKLLTVQAMTLLGRNFATRSKDSVALTYVKKCVRYLDVHFEEEIQMQDVSKEIGLSIAYLQRLFKQQFQMTMTDYILDKRLEKAKILLSNTKIPVADICFLVGFNHRQYFTQQFTKRIGHSPKQYRSLWGRVDICERPLKIRGN